MAAPLVDFGPMFEGLIPWAIFAIVAGLLIRAFRTSRLPKIKGRIGEATVNFRVERQLDPDVYHLIRNLMLPSFGGTTQIDHVIVSRYGVFVVETKTFDGWIFGQEREPQWTQVLFKRKQQFRNPLLQNYKHTKTLADLTGLPHDSFKSVVVFAGDCTFKTDMPDNVVYARDLAGYVEGFQTPVMGDQTVSQIISTIEAWASTVTDEQKDRHVAYVRGNRQPVSADADAPDCPRCGTPMVLRTNRRDDNRFWGCPKYPACHGTRRTA